MPRTVAPGWFLAKQRRALAFVSMPSTTLNPAASQPMEEPPPPQKRSAHRSRSCVTFAADTMSTEVAEAVVGCVRAAAPFVGGGCRGPQSRGVNGAAASAAEALAVRGRCLRRRRWRREVQLAPVAEPWSVRVRVLDEPVRVLAADRMGLGVGPDRGEAGVDRDGSSDAAAAPAAARAQVEAPDEEPPPVHVRVLDVTARVPSVDMSVPGAAPVRGGVEAGLEGPGDSAAAPAVVRALTVSALSALAKRLGRGGAPAGRRNTAGVGGGPWGRALQACASAAGALTVCAALGRLMSSL